VAVVAAVAVEVQRKVIAVREVVGFSVVVVVVVAAAAEGEEAKVVGATVAKKHPKVEKRSPQTSWVRLLYVYCLIVVVGEVGEGQRVL
jgi:hypothetical protein